MNDRLPFLRDKTKTLTASPGCYLMRGKQGEIIYIGKAKNLKKRVTSYFRQCADHLPKVEKMVSQVQDYDYIVTESEFEALVLECSLIKQHSPKYNILLKDDKGYHYIRISGDKWGRISATKQMVDDGATYIGPYVSSFAVTQAVEEANTAFRLPTCSRRFPQDFKKSRPCLNYHIKRCMGVCKGVISEQEYEETLSQAISFLRSDSANTIHLLTEQMEQAAQDLLFERAARLRDRIEGIRRINEHQKVMYNDTPDQDVIALAQGREQAYAVVLKFRGHRLVDKESFPLGEIEGLDAARGEFVVRYYS
ncbi:MAG: excinuclease ABC subunit UvrC, partial [Acetanaerobacterium sp.]